MACPARVRRVGCNSATLADLGMPAGSCLGAYGDGDSGAGDAGAGAGDAGGVPRCAAPDPNASPTRARSTVGSCPIAAVWNRCRSAMDSARCVAASRPVATESA